MSENHYQNAPIAEPVFRLIHFRTEWSGACQIVAMMIENLVDSYRGRVAFQSTDIEKEPAFATAYGITEVPTVLLFKGADVVAHSVGTISRQELIDKIEKSLREN
jgi:thioredoxin 1